MKKIEHKASDRREALEFFGLCLFIVYGIKAVMAFLIWLQPA